MSVTLRSLITKLLPQSLQSTRSIENEFDELKESLKETLRGKLREEFEKVKSGKSNLTLSKNDEEPKITKEDFEKFNGKWENHFKESVSISLNPAVTGHVRGRPHTAPQVIVNVTNEFASECDHYGVNLSVLFQERGSKHLIGKGFDVKNFNPTVSAKILHTSDLKAA